MAAQAAFKNTSQLLRTTLQRCQQTRNSGFVSELVQKVKTEVHSNPELKKSLETLRQATDTIKERSKTLSSEAVQAADAASQQFRQQAAQASSTLRETVSRATQSTAEAGQPLHSAQQSPGTGEASATGNGAAPSATAAGSSGAAAGSTGQQQQQQQQQQHEEEGSSTAEEHQGASGPAGSASSSQPARPSLADRVRRLAAAVRTEVVATLSPDTGTTSATRVRPQQPKAAHQQQGPSQLLVVPQPETAWQRQWRKFKEKYGQSEVFKRLGHIRENQVFSKAGDLADDLRERWETSDSAFVHRVQDLSDNMMAETEMAKALREIRARDAHFDMVRFLRSLKIDIPVIIKAYLEGDTQVLREHCSPEMLERLSAIIAAQVAQGLHTDPTILDTSEVDLVDLKLLEGDPIIVAQFNCQQLNCTRDKFGNVVEGAPDDVHRVYYYWALQQEPAGFVGADGKQYPPRWQLREMMVRGMHNLL